MAAAAEPVQPSGGYGHTFSDNCLYENPDTTEPATSTWPPPIGPDVPPELAAFQEVGNKMVPVVRSLLLDGLDPSEVPAHTLLIALGHQSQHRVWKAAHEDHLVIKRLLVLSPSSCATLRNCVDQRRRVTADTVDQCPEHQRDVAADELEALIGTADFGRLMSLPQLYHRTQNLENSDEEADEVLEQGLAQAVDAPVRARGVALLIKAFIRRYSAETRPFNPFHKDTCGTTVNVALSPDSGHQGGRLLGVCDGKVQVLERDEGEATVHSSDMLHGVSRMTDGVRYSLILFFS